MAEKKKSGTMQMVDDLNYQKDLIALWGDIEEAGTQEEKDVLKAELAVAMKASLQAIDDRISSIDWVKKQVELVDAEARRFANIKKSLNDYVSFVRGILKGHMEEIGEKKLETPNRRSITISNTNPSLDMDDRTRIPRKYYVKVPATEKLDEKALIADLKAAEKEGKTIRGLKGVRLKKNTSLRIN